VAIWPARGAKILRLTIREYLIHLAPDDIVGQRQMTAQYPKERKMITSLSGGRTYTAIQLAEELKESQRRTPLGSRRDLLVATGNRLNLPHKYGRFTPAVSAILRAAARIAHI